MSRASITIEALNLWAFVSRSLANIIVSQFLVDLRQADRTMTGSRLSTSAFDSQVGGPIQFFVATTEELGQRTAPGVLEEDEEIPEELELAEIETHARD